MHRLLLTVPLCLFSLTATFTQSLPILNGSAISLPRPVYSKEYKALCASGEVRVKVTVGIKGTVEEASPISGDAILSDSAVAAAQKARFRFGVDGPPVKHTGVVVYNFPNKDKCFEAGVVNNKALKLATPQLKLAPGTYKDGTVHVRVIINELGDVIMARALNGHPLFRVPCEKAAMNSKFPPTNGMGRIRAKERSSSE